MDKDKIIEILIDYFENLIPLTREEQELVKQNFHYRLFRKRQYVQQEGDVCKQYTFVVKGCLRMYKVDKQGNEHILKFAAETDWVTEINSFYNLCPSALDIDALEDTEVLQISRDDLISLYQQAPKFDRIFRILTENGFSKLQQRHLQSISVSAEERYRSFVEIYPHLLNRISQIQIAAFLGITPEFLSRLRSRQSKNPLAKS
ncbi:Crp/Fnr family transcriptional regulator [Olivibacter jilunii]|uniref:Crp/Fnr family transcriptional regulator n=1 Tax=Olivibacter jilunii TaxID=985016 RepID=UPI003F13BE88